ncbi:uncharacterized protein FFB20_05906 [Fusarium fujikuroi]|uniref:BZIP domain-containing protein n=1 Tax=Gibberella fujikuroi (strain CBS 195.34 / IMI 58289 / NRRL A-6831) TaxID=1279085 RepID=S0EAT6_GIBF5|nr:uncharacterized protein FFUJ_05454 [Fusarium fujikuroi IMI 58289]KLP08542.1 uncharacterized protein Y057_13890 [Fusarium fujikuroi]KLP15781.1 uncharacterized protein LW94_7297 [Fusarium fujikuroi]QGI65384.1 hypothetical protein CEK27_009355 [Fusarium fujikuroi]QGI96267.1 hypothetical protein CEK26_009336 [Fusarium fujikuroi]CCT69558.1 uncharacterized protein FFUJ_05454 [Fusarium fujikuroi IMI 58289]
MSDTIKGSSANENDTVSRKRTSSRDGDAPPAKRRVLTTARREQNRQAQKAYRERQKQERIRLKQERAQAKATCGQRLRPLLKREDLSPVDSSEQQSSIEEISLCDESLLEPIDTSAKKLEPNFPDLYMNMLQFSPAAIFTSCLTNALSLGLDPSVIANCSVEHISPFYQPNLSSTLNHAALIQAGSNILSTFDNTSIPIHLRPTMAQILIPHHTSLDLIPIPFLRERAIMLSAAMPHVFNNWELKLDIYERGGLTIWRLKHEKGESVRDTYPPWDMKSWEAAPWFMKKWCMLMGREYDKMRNQSVGWQIVRDLISSRDIQRLTTS